MKKIKLFCLPYAGGSSSRIYVPWKKYLNSKIELNPIEIAGRGRKTMMPHYKNFEEAVADICGQIQKELGNEEEYALFGHSMGSLLVFEVVHKLVEKGYKKPTHVFVSGRKPPHIISSRDKKIHHLPDENFKEEILKLKGTSREIFENKELASIFIPILRNDYKILENYEYIEKKNKFDFPITAISGDADELVGVEELIGWKHHTTNQFNYHIFNGGHFFIHEKEKEIADIINKYI